MTRTLSFHVNPMQRPGSGVERHNNGARAGQRRPGGVADRLHHLHHIRHRVLMVAIDSVHGTLQTDFQNSKRTTQKESRLIYSSTPRERLGTATTVHHCPELEDHHSIVPLNQTIFLIQQHRPNHLIIQQHGPVSFLPSSLLSSLLSQPTRLIPTHPYTQPHRTYTSIPTHLIPWLKAQHMFFVASSALAVPAASSCTTPHDINRGSEDEAAGQERGLAYEKSPVWGYANVSPRDMAGFEVLSETCVRCKPTFSLPSPSNLHCFFKVTFLISDKLWYVR